MKTLTLLPLLAALCIASPATSSARDEDRQHRGHDYDSHHHHSHDYGHHSYHRSTPVVSFGYRPYSYGYPSYYSGYPYYSSSYDSEYPYYSSSYYSRPSIGLSFSTGPSYSRGVRSSGYDNGLAVDVQRALARRGYYRGALDGDIGTGTRAAIRRYQYDRRLEVTGRVDRALLDALDLS